MLAELPGQTAGGHQKDPGEGDQQREIHQQPAGTSDPGVPQRSGQTQRGKNLQQLGGTTFLGCLSQFDLLSLSLSI